MSSFDLRDPDRFTTAAIGPPGERVFYLQGVEGTEVVTLRLEKQQVAALAQYLRGVLSDLPIVADDERPTEFELVEPAVAEWLVGTMAVAYDQADDRIVLQADELLDEDAVEEAAEEAAEEGSHARFRLTRAQVLAFCDHAEGVVASGRPPCPICGRPMDPDGHICPRSNGHLHS
jgi:uncharacterized repeat protein (TIGR03847 family)